MIYQARINKRVRNERVYVVSRRLGSGTNILTRLFMKLFRQEGPKNPEESAGTRLG
jgi:hypothetical protein